MATACLSFPPTDHSWPFESTETLQGLGGGLGGWDGGVGGGGFGKVGGTEA